MFLDYTHLFFILSTECEKIEAQFINWSDAGSIAAVTLSVVGLLATLAAAAIFARYRTIF